MHAGLGSRVKGLGVREKERERANSNVLADVGGGVEVILIVTGTSQDVLPASAVLQPAGQGEQPGGACPGTRIPPFPRPVAEYHPMSHFGGALLSQLAPSDTVPCA